MAPLTASIQDLFEYKREERWRGAGVPEIDIIGSGKTGMDAADVQTFRLLSNELLLFVIRCPKVTARAWHGLFPPKMMAVKEKTGSSGTVVTEKHGIFVSDYDMMSVWKQADAGWTKIFISAADGASRGAWTNEARTLVMRLNQSLVSRIQHGCQDDFHSLKNPGVKVSDHFAAFARGKLHHFQNPAECAQFYERYGLAWPYDSNGTYRGTIA